MPRTRRLTPGGFVYHVLNRANARLKIFSSQADYEEFLQAMREALGHVPTRVLAYCLMPDHWHLVIWPRREGELSEFMRRLSVTHTRRWHARKHSTGTGHLYQGRYRSFPVEPDEHLLTVCRYVESNPARSQLVKRAADWQWSSLQARSGTKQGKGDGEAAPLVTGNWPVELPRNWSARVEAAPAEAELSALRGCVQRGTPFGSPEWQVKTARKLRLESTMRARGRPRKTPPAAPAAKKGAGVSVRRREA